MKLKNDYNKIKKILYVFIALYALILLSLKTQWITLYFNDPNVLNLINGQSTNLLKYTDLYLPLGIVAVVCYLLSIDLAKNEVNYLITLPVNLKSFIINRTILWNLLLNIICAPLMIILIYNFEKQYFVGILNIKYCVMAWVNMFVISLLLSALGVLILSITHEIGYAIAIILFCVFFDYFSQGRYSRFMSIFPISFRYSIPDKINFWINRVLYLFISLFTLALSTYFVKKESTS